MHRSAVTSRLALSGLCLLALAMVLSIMAEAVRAALREDLRYVAPAALGFGLGLLTLKFRHSLSRAWRAPADSASTPWLVLLIPLGLQMILILLVRTVPASDWGSYSASAVKLLQTGEYVCEMGSGTTFRAHKPPGVALYVAAIYWLFGASALAVQLCNAAVVLCGNALFYLLLRGRWGRPSALLATALLAWWPSRSFSVLLPGYDAPGSLLILLFWWLAQQHRAAWRWTDAAAGTALGAAAMLRMPLLLLLPGYLAYLILGGVSRRVLLSRAVILSCGVGLIMTPWAWRNDRLFSEVVLTGTQGGPSFYRGFHPAAGRYYTNIGWQKLLEESGGDEIRLNRLGWRHGFEFIAADPAAAGVRILRKWQRLLESDHELAGFVFDTPSGPLSSTAYRHLRSSACGLSDTWYAWLAMSLLGIGLSARRQPRVPTGLLWPLLAVSTALVAHGLFESQPRYMVLYQCFLAAAWAKVWMETSPETESG